MKDECLWDPLLLAKKAVTLSCKLKKVKFPSQELCEEGNMLLCLFSVSPEHTAAGRGVAHKCRAAETVCFFHMGLSLAAGHF